MVNQTLLDYLKNYKDKYPLDALKKQIVSSGYSESDFNEAIALLNQDKDKGNLDFQDMGKLEVKEIGFKGGLKWMRLAGIIGISLMILTLVIFLSLYIFSGNAIIQIINLILFFLMFISTFFFYFGFFKLGKYADSKLLKFSSISIMILEVLVVVFIVIGVVFAYSSLSSNLPNGGITGAAVSAVDGGALNIDGILGPGAWTIIIISILFILFFIIVMILFFIGLLKVDVKLAKITGILGIIHICIITLLTLLLAFNPLFLIAIVFSNTASILFVIFEIVMAVFSLLILLLESLTLLNASKQFENSGY